MKIVECVPNFSEGRNNDIITYIATQIKKVEGVKLLNVDVGMSANRTVYTFAGEPMAVVEAAFESIKAASQVIDMSKHIGEHPRMGACDVCPLIPIKGITMQEVVELSFILSERVGKELKIPVYNYEFSSSNPLRKRLEQIRKGEYEALEHKLKSDEWIPDFGPSVFNVKSGATVIGARNFLLAYNINLSTNNVNIAKKIAGQIRESGSRIVVDGNTNIKPGIFKNLKAIGWYMEQFNKVQISTNITDFNTTPIHEVFETVKLLADQYNTKVTGSELVGLIPKQALLDAALSYGFDVDNEIYALNKIVEKLGLNDVKPFLLEDRILDYLLVDV